jgi:hypothetical protein
MTVASGRTALWPFVTSFTRVGSLQRTRYFPGGSESKTGGGIALKALTSRKLVL